jgi:putative ABC transport system permease protein
MRKLLTQATAVAMMNLRALPRRPWLTLSAAVSVALVVTVLLGFQALAHGFRVAVNATGSDDVALVLREGSQTELNSTLSMDQVRVVQEAPGIARAEDGRPIASPELYVVVNGPPGSASHLTNIALRGVGEYAPRVRDGVTVSAGRMFVPGRAELVVGRMLARQFPEFSLGGTLVLGGRSFQVVGLFDAKGSALESEAWTDYRTVQGMYNRGANVQSLHVRLTDPAALRGLADALAADPRLKLEAVRERQYYARIARGTVNLVFFLGWPLAIVMSLGALAAMLNSTYGSVAARRRDFATLRVIGFEPLPVFLGGMCEGLLIALAGALAATACVALVLDGISASTLGGGFTQIVFSIRLDARIVAQAMVLALLVGLTGGAMAAARAARIDVLATFRD